MSAEHGLTREQLRAGQDAHRASGTPMSLALWLAAHDAEVRASVATPERWQYGAQSPDDPEGKVVAWSRGFTKHLVEQQGHHLFRRRPGTAPGPWVPVKQEEGEL